MQFALEDLQVSYQYEFDFMLNSGNLLSLARNQKILPWDSDTDFFVIFKNETISSKNTPNIINDFRLQLKQKMDYFLKTETISYWNKYCTELIHIDIFPKQGYADIFILHKNSFTNRIGGCDCQWTPFQRWYDASILLPVKRVNFTAYNITVNVPNDIKRYLEIEYGNDWMIPDPKGYNQHCEQIDNVTVNLWIQDIQMRFQKIKSLVPVKCFFVLFSLSLSLSVFFYVTLLCVYLCACVFSCCVCITDRRARYCR